MEKLTAKQKQIFDYLVKNNDRSLEVMRREIMPNLTRQAVHDRVRLMVKKGYLQEAELPHPFKGKAYVPTSKGLDFILKHGQETKRTVWDKAERLERARKRAQTTIKQKQNRTGNHSG
jgi:predicted transcriptional regulator